MMAKPLRAAMAPKKTIVPMPVPPLPKVVVVSSDWHILEESKEYPDLHEDAHDPSELVSRLLSAQSFPPDITGSQIPAAVNS